MHLEEQRMTFIWSDVLHTDTPRQISAMIHKSERRDAVLTQGTIKLHRAHHRCTEQLEDGNKIASLLMGHHVVTLQIIQTGSAQLSCTCTGLIACHLFLLHSLGYLGSLSFPKKASKTKGTMMVLTT